MWPIIEKENRQLLIMWPNIFPYSKLKYCVVTVLLLTSTPLVMAKERHLFFTATADDDDTFSTTFSAFQTLPCKTREVVNCHIF